MQPDHEADLQFAAEERRRRRLGLPPPEPPEVLSGEYLEVTLAFGQLAIQAWDRLAAGIDDQRAAFQLLLGSFWRCEVTYLGEVATAGRATEALEQQRQYLAELRALVMRVDGTREPGEEG